jgi:Holliday junction resolvasome RuvABC endonuclease subunit
MSTRVLGIDPGFASVGVAVVELEPSLEKVLHLAVIRTEKSALKREVRASDDNLRRARLIYEGLIAMCELHSVRVLCIESMSFPRNAGAASKVAMTWGVIAAIATHLRIPVVQASPQEVKKCVCGSKNASKEEVEAALRKAYSIEDLAEGVLFSQKEHVFDALAVVKCCLDSEVLRMARNLG